MLHCRLFEKFTFFCSLEHAFSSAYLSRTCRRLLANTDSKYSVGQRALSGRSAVCLLFTKSSQQLASCDQVSTFSAMIYSWQNREPPRHLYLLCAHPPLWILSSKPKRLQVTEPAGISWTKVRFMHRSSFLFTNGRWKPRMKDGWTSQNVRGSDTESPFHLWGSLRVSDRSRSSI